MRITFLYVFQRTQYQRKRGAQFMGDVGVEAQAFVVQFLLVFVALLLQLVQCFSIQSFLVGIEYREKDDKGQQDIE